jgi:hypothetical protein
VLPAVSTQPILKNHDKEETHLKNMRIGLLEVARRFLWFL